MDDGGGIEADLRHVVRVAREHIEFDGLAVYVAVQILAYGVLKAGQHQKILVGQVAVIHDQFVVGDRQNAVPVLFVFLFQLRRGELPVRDGAVGVEIGFVVSAERQKVFFHTTILSLYTVYTVVGSRKKHHRGGTESDTDPAAGGGAFPEKEDGKQNVERERPDRDGGIDQRR